MKTLYESILDDEEVLIDNLKKDINNPFNILMNLNEEDCQNRSIVLKILRDIEYVKQVDKNYLSLRIDIDRFSGNKVIRNYYLGYPVYPPDMRDICPICRIRVFITNDGREIEISSPKHYTSPRDQDKLKQVFGSASLITNWIKKVSKKYKIEVY
jgi:hypothetical protein